MARSSSATRIALVLNCLGHAVVCAGLGFGIGPVRWDPAAFLVRGAPARHEPGLEALFPKILAAVYGSFAAGSLYALLSVTPDAARAAVVPCVVYHFGAAVEAGFGSSDAVNAKALNPAAPAVGHAVFFAVAVAVLVTSWRIKPKAA